MANIKHAALLTLDQARAAFEYDPLTGIFRWKQRGDVPRKWNSRHAGKIAGCLQSGYNTLTHRNVHIRAHQVAWLLSYGVWPEHAIDHINGDPMDNRIANLRAATIAQNGWNSGKKASNTSGAKGVMRCSSTGKWYAQIRTGGGKRLTLGRFVEFEDAKAAYAEAAVRLHGEFARLE